MSVLNARTVRENYMQYSELTYAEAACVMHKTFATIRRWAAQPVNEKNRSDPNGRYRWVQTSATDAARVDRASLLEYRRTFQAQGPRAAKGPGGAVSLWFPKATGRFRVREGEAVALVGMRDFAHRWPRLWVALCAELESDDVSLEYRVWTRGRVSEGFEVRWEPANDAE